MPAARNCGGVVLHKGAVAPDQEGEASRLSDSRLHSLAAARATSLRRPLPNIALQQTVYRLRFAAVLWQLLKAGVWRQETDDIQGGFLCNRALRRFPFRRRGSGRDES